MEIIVLSSYSYIIKVNNYGSILQYYALQTYLERKGHNVKWLKYEAIKKTPKGLNKWLREKFLHSYFKTDNVEYYNKEGFSQFINKYINLTSQTYITSKELYTLPPKADLYIVGSDQVWNGYSPDRFLTFVPKNIPKISYAVSFGKNKIPQYMKPLIWFYLKSFKAISVRETEGVKLCHSLGRKDAKYTIDPSFLLNKEDYTKIIKNDKSITTIPYPYIYGYFVNPFPDNILTEKTSIDSFLKNSQLPFFVTGIQNAEFALKEYNIINPSPLEWINTILNAKYIITNSFHGVAFSINLQKNFLLISQAGDMANQNCRYFNLLKRLGLEDRIYNSTKGSLEKQMKASINWDKVEIEKNKFISESQDFLLNEISKIKK
ncbi:polysaccharide pyruvyl transferase family protein [Phocaeicola coprophilus]|uniref:polysaccharide pyruvyl transferase family protein n=1 Tax=Phocaeicola coprophilus TaxID=387090 RepID=UPI0039F4ADC1